MTSRSLRAGAIGLFVVLAFIIFATFQDYGMSWDEQLQNTYGQLLLAYYSSGFQDRAAFSYINLFLYGGFFDLVAAVVNLVSPFGEYETRHLLGGLMFLVGLAGGWKLAKLLAGERAALVAVVCLATTPLLYGHAFINPKDSPLAWLLVWTSYFACRLLEQRDKPSWSMIAGFGLSMGLAIGTRVVAIVYLTYAVAVWSVAAAARILEGESISTVMQRLKSKAIPIGVGLLVTVITTIIVWPWAAQAPFNVVEALNAFTHFAFYPDVLWNGALIPAHQLPVTYLPGLLLLQLPEYMLAGFGTAIVFGALAWKGNVARVLSQIKAQQYLLVALSIAAPIGGYLLLHPTVYNGLRHFLFVVPPLVIVAAIGLTRLIEATSARHAVAGIGLGAALALAIARQASLMAGLHPYEYASYNSLIGGMAGAKDRFEMDYWGTTLKESGKALGDYIAHDPSAASLQGRTAKIFACGDPNQVQQALPQGTEFTGDLGEADFYLGMQGVHCFESFSGPVRRVREVTRLGTPLGYVLDLRPQTSP